MESALQPLLNGNVSNVDMTVTLGAGAADIDFSDANIPRDYMGALLRITDSSGRSIYGFVYTDGAGTIQNIVSAKGGSTRNWAAQEADFDDDDDGGYAFQLSRTPPVVVASGTVTAANFKVDFTNDNSYVELVGVDLSPYQDGRHLIGLYLHADNHAMLGHISDVAPAGETLGPELITVADDRDFTSDTGFWTLGTGWEITGGKAVCTASPGNLQRFDLLEHGANYRIVGDYTIASNNLYVQAGFWHTRVYAGVGYTVDMFCKFQEGSGGVAGYTSIICTGTVDNVSWKRITDIATTGALIVSTQRGATRSWYYINSHWQTDWTYDYKIYFIGD